VGNKTTHMQQAFQINDPSPAAGAVQNRRQLPQWGSISDSRFSGNGNYNALQTKFAPPLSQTLIRLRPARLVPP
jgi:hypothetical protein